MFIFVHSSKHGSNEYWQWSIIRSTKLLDTREFHCFMGFGWGSICIYNICWVDVVGMGKERSGSWKPFEHCVDVIMHLHNLFNECIKPRSVASRSCERIFMQLHILWVVVLFPRDIRQRDVTFSIFGKFLVRALTLNWSSAVWNSIAAPDGCWCGALGGDGTGGRLVSGGGAVDGWCVYFTRIFGWDSRRECRIIWVNGDSTDIQGSLITPPPGIFAPIGQGP